MSEVASAIEALNYVGGVWQAANVEGGLELTNPATGESLGRSGAGGAAEVS
jgi:hypothetical protein